jgi:hypothetical protein
LNLDSLGRALRRLVRGQSLVEFTVMLPVLLIMLIEYGILLNYYLDVIDAARDAARFAADGDPLMLGDEFFTFVRNETKHSLLKASDGRIEWFGTVADPAECGVEIRGDIVISTFSVLSDPLMCAAKGEAAPCVDKWFTGSGGGGENGNSMCGAYSSSPDLKQAALNEMLKGGGIPNAGFVIVEIYYEYEQVLGLPWIKAFAADPIVLHAYSLMPNVHVEPTPTP